jgi:hypothetical protein
MFAGGEATGAELSRAQRILIITVCLATAALLHVSLCNWYWRVGAGRGGLGVALLGWNQPVAGVAPGVFTGLRTGAGVDQADGLVFGVAVPILLLGAAGFVALGWRRAARTAAGRCPGCGYDLRGGCGAACPECGRGRPVSSRDGA